MKIAIVTITLNRHLKGVVDLRDYVILENYTPIYHVKLIGSPDPNGLPEGVSVKGEKVEIITNYKAPVTNSQVLEDYYNASVFSKTKLNIKALYEEIEKEIHAYYKVPPEYYFVNPTVSPSIKSGIETFDPELLLLAEIIRTNHPRVLH